MDEWKILAEQQALIIEDLAKLCRELTEELLHYRNVNEINESLDYILRKERVVL